MVKLNGQSAGSFRALLRAICILLLLAAVFSVVSVLEAQDHSPAWPSGVRIIYLPVVGKDETLKRFEPLSRHLEKVLGLEVESTSFDSYEEVIGHLALAEFELAYLSPATYVESARHAGLEPVAMELDRFGNRGYHGLIICRSDSGFRSVKDIQGKALAFTNKQSTSGYLVPYNYILREFNKTPDSFAGSIGYTGDHQHLIKGVLEGSYDAGATNDVDLSRTIKAGNVSPDAIRVLWTSDLIPGPPVCVRSDLPESFKAAVLGALIMFNNDKEGVKELQIGGFGPAADKDYELVRRLQEIRP